MKPLHPRLKLGTFHHSEFAPEQRFIFSLPLTLHNSWKELYDSHLSGNKSDPIALAIVQRSLQFQIYYRQSPG